MKTAMFALLAAGAMLTLAGCCCDKTAKGCDKPARKMCCKPHHNTPKTCAPEQCPKHIPAQNAKQTAAPAAQQQTPAATATETVVIEAVGN